MRRSIFIWTAVYTGKLHRDGISRREECWIGTYRCAPSERAINGKSDQSLSVAGLVPSSAIQSSTSGPLQSMISDLHLCERSPKGIDGAPYFQRSEDSVARSELTAHGENQSPTRLDFA